MKQSVPALMFFLTILIGTSCSHKPNNLIHETKTEPAGWIVKEKGQKPEMSYDTYYKISPTWGQATHYAYKTTGQAIAVFISFILFAAFVVVLAGLVTDAGWMPKPLQNPNLVSAALFLLLSSSIYAWYNKPGNIKFNNDKWIKKEVYDKAIKEAGSTQPIWDSLEANNLIVDGSY